MLAFQFGKGPLDVLAGAQGIYGKVRAGTEIKSRFFASNNDTVGVSVRSVGDREFREERFFTQVLQRKILSTAVLAAQRDLPFFHRQVLGFAGTGRFDGLGLDVASLVYFVNH